MLVHTQARRIFLFPFFPFFSSLLSLFLLVSFSVSLFIFLPSSLFLSFSFLYLSCVDRLMSLSLGNTAARALCDLTYDPASRTVTFERHR